MAIRYYYFEIVYSLPVYTYSSDLILFLKVTSRYVTNLGDREKESTGTEECKGI